MEIYTKSANETISLGKKVGELLSPGDVVLLDGDLGAGKTTLTKGIGEALGVFRTINSPTFTIMKMYEGKYPLYHMDLYRLNGSGMDFDLEDYIFGDGISHYIYASDKQHAPADIARMCSFGEYISYDTI